MIWVIKIVKYYIMKKIFQKNNFLIDLFVLVLSSCGFCIADNSELYNYVSYVDPYIGSGGHGHVFVGANVPWGMIQVGPQNIHQGWDWCSGYHYSDSIIIGFSHTHLSGTGCADLGDILIMPFAGDINIDNSYSSCYSHRNESVSPGYYSLLMDNGINVELTATKRVAFHRYKYPLGAPRLLINLEEGNGDYAYETSIRLIDKYHIEGYRFSNGWSPRHKVYFVLKSDQPIANLDVFNGNVCEGNNSHKGNAVKAVVSFVNNPTKVNLKVSISSVSCANALANMEMELPDWNFERTRINASSDWNKMLSCVKVKSDNKRLKKIFYTSLYHMFMAPTLYCDSNGEFRGHNDSIYKADSWTNYSTFSLWDTYRAYHPLLTLIKPEYISDMVNSMLSIYDQQGKLPIWPLIGGETNQMPGYSAIPVIADAYLKGFDGFDAERALKYMVSSATNETQNGLTYLMNKGYIPCDKIHEATSIAMEYAVGDWAIALMAKKMGYKDIYDEFIKRGYYYEKYFDKNINFIRPRMNDASWRIPYDPFRSVHSVGDFCEGNGWHYTFFVPQNPEGLISLMGGDKYFLQKLDSLFSVNGDMGESASADISGLIGMYAHGNEPSHHVAYLYAYAGEQWKTADKVRYIQETFYTDKVDGIIGNEDCGQMSAWYILSALGFYQVNPSNGVYVFGSPLFEYSEILLPKDKVFKIISHNNSKDNKYIQSVTLNGKSYTKSFINYEDIVNGGTLIFEMGKTPNKKFGLYPEDRPSSLK